MRPIPGAAILTKNRRCDCAQVLVTAIAITDIEAAINFWRDRAPSRGGIVLADATRALAEVYAQLVYLRALEVDDAALPPAAYAAWLQWYDATPDTPCIAICSTSQGDAQCKGCGRSFAEVQQWLAMDAVEKRAVWQRINREGTAWRFNRYAERAGLQTPLCSA